MAGRKSRSDRNARRRAHAGPPPLEPAPALSLRHPAVLVVLLVAAALVVTSVTHLLYDTDFWQHLLVGKVIWTQHRVPATQLWSWPAWGRPDVNYAWGFEALIWLWGSWSGLAGLFAWRWLTTLLAFGFLWAAARRMGARGFTPLVVAVLCALVYRQRSQVRPETLVAVLFAIEVWLLETRRQGGPDRTWWLVPCAWVWANVHLTWYLGFVLLGVHLADALWTAWRPPGTDPTARDAARARAAGLVRVGLACVAVSFVNPFGWRALWQPVHYVLFMRHEALYRLISELGPVDWSRNLWNGLPVLLALWALLLLWRWWRRGIDRVEILMAALFVPTALASQRLLGNLALAAFPYLARDLDEWVRARRWPRWTAAPAARAALAALACVGIAAPELSRSDPPLGIGLEWKAYPVAACDFMAQHGVRGRAFNHFRTGGYMLWRFWPDRGRLPFMDVHQAGTPDLRRRYLEALARPGGWEALDREFHFDYALLARPQVPGDILPDVLDADSAWAPVFVDDAAALYVRRDGPLAALADSLGYRVLGAGHERLLAVNREMASDSMLRPRVAAELRRQIAESRTAALSHSMLANVELLDGRPEEARAEIARALAVEPRTPQAHERLGRIALSAGRPREAIAEFERELRADPASHAALLGLGLAWQEAGDVGQARAAFLRVLKRWPEDEMARVMLGGLQEGTAR